MIGYKATYNFKCINQTYSVGKTYTSDKMKVCAFGMHFCEKIENVLNYYEPTKDLVILEVEILGDVETRKDKSVTNKLKVLRVIPKEEYPSKILKKLLTHEYDEHGNMISATSPNGTKYTYKYDERGNKISETYPNGNKYTCEYDEHGNMISATFPNGDKYTYEYDERGNKISETYPNGNKYTCEYDEHGNMISATFPNGDKYTYEYATITEED